MMILKRCYKIRRYLQHVSVASATSIIRESLLRNLQHRVIKYRLITHTQFDLFTSFINVKICWT